jgi:integrase
MAEKLIKRGNTWYFRYTDADGRRVMRKGCADKKVSEDMLAAAERDAARVRAGIVNTKELAYKEHEKTPLSEHLDNWEQTLSAAGSTPKHVRLFSARARRVAALVMGAKLRDIEPANHARKPDIAKAAANLLGYLTRARLSDLTEERVQKALATLRQEGRSLQTLNHHRVAVRAFSKWCHDTRRTQEDDLRRVKGFNVKEDPRHPRRTISVEELHRLIAVAEQGPVVLGMPGPIRALCYRLAASTGLRFSEISSIRPASFDWKAPTVTIKAAYTKNGDPATLTLQRDLAGDLAAYVATLAPGQAVFPLPSERGARMLRADLAVAGIEYQDASGLFFDFHSLRCEMATLADGVGISPRVVQRLMRLSSDELVNRYTRPRTVDIEAAAGKLPALKPVGDRPEALVATGTDGATHEQTLAPPLLHFQTAEGRHESSSVMMTGSDVQASMDGKCLKIGDFVADGRPESPSVADARTQSRRMI